MDYYGKRTFDDAKRRVDEAVRSGVHSLRASYLTETYGLDVRIAQQVLSDLSATRDLKAHYLLLCSGEHQNFDADREFERLEDIPHHQVTCNVCGDTYMPGPENVEVSFEPTKQYLESLSRGLRA